MHAARLDSIVAAAAAGAAAAVAEFLQQQPQPQQLHPSRVTKLSIYQLSIVFKMFLSPKKLYIQKHFATIAQYVISDMIGMTSRLGKKLWKTLAQNL